MGEGKGDWARGSLVSLVSKYYAWKAVNCCFLALGCVGERCSLGRRDIKMSIPYDASAIIGIVQFA